MTTITRDQLSALLHTGECVIEFTKVDGTVRAMPCTLSETLIPPPPVHIDNPIDFPAPKKEKKQNPDIMSVWCLDKKEWRSFRIANVISAKAKDENSI
jgi:WYL_2, Sm-like SH3 beta-barrel fold